MLENYAIFLTVLCSLLTYNALKNLGLKRRHEEKWKRQVEQNEAWMRNYEELLKLKNTYRKLLHKEMIKDPTYLGMSESGTNVSIISGTPEQLRELNEDFRKGRVDVDTIINDPSGVNTEDI